MYLHFLNVSGFWRSYKDEVVPYFCPFCRPDRGASLVSLRTGERWVGRVQGEELYDLILKFVMFFLQNVVGLWMVREILVVFFSEIFCFSKSLKRLRDYFYEWFLADVIIVRQTCHSAWSSSWFILCPWLIRTRIFIVLAVQFLSNFMSKLKLLLIRREI